MWRVSLCLAVILPVTAAASQQLADPTAPPQQVRAPMTANQQATELRLQAVQQRTDGTVATINGQRVREGDILAPYIITKITMNQVDVRHQQTGAEISLSMFSKALGSGGQD